METSHDLQRTQSSTTIKARCPDCQKLYIVDASLIQVSAPEFECVTCQTRFWFSFPLPQGTVNAETYPVPTEEELAALAAEEQAAELAAEIEAAAALEAASAAAAAVQAPTQAPAASNSTVAVRFEMPNERIIETPPAKPAPKTEKSERSLGGAISAPVKALQTEMVACPKCGKQNAVQAEECVSCGVIMKKFKIQQQEMAMVSDPMIKGSAELETLWKTVVSDYSNESLHQEFIQACWENDSLPFAAHKYARILSAAPQEEIALNMRSRVITLAASQFEVVAKAVPWKTLRSFSLNSWVIFLGSMVMTTGFLLPNMRNLVGVGVAMISLAIGLRIYLRRP